MTSTRSPGANPAACWDDRYGAPGFARGEQPNDSPRVQAGSLSPGESLCLAEGEGRNAAHPAHPELLMPRERRRWIEEGLYHHGDSAVLRIPGRKSA
ncbi:MAG: hypothetical protein FJ083_06410 [Cyanobacteria bacterium K_Offshore_surface_m2_239]|nr:hypothetical protein [Cyanobacteria bacterium K_Offshore_surface_m2_239]